MNKIKLKSYWDTTIALEGTTPLIFTDPEGYGYSGVEGVGSADSMTLTETVWKFNTKAASAVFRTRRNHVTIYADSK